MTTYIDTIKSALALGAMLGANTTLTPEDAQALLDEIKWIETDCKDWQQTCQLIMKLNQDLLARNAELRRRE